MIAKLLILVVVAAAVLMAVNWFNRTPPEQVIKTLKKTGLYAIIGVFLLLALTGRLPWLFALAAAAVPLLQRGLIMLRLVPLVQQLMASIGLAKAVGGPSTGKQSKVETPWLRMTLDHDSGAMDGEVLQGEHRGQRLSALSLSQLLTLRDDCDPQSLQLLDTWLDREHGDDWRQRAGAGSGAGTGHGANNSGPAPPRNAAMDRKEAYEVLGLEPGASTDEVRAAHRRLIQRLHPDRGGSTFLATKINEAKQVLLQS
jgi:hypothetical protein